MTLRVRRENHISVLHLGKYYPPDRGGIESYLEALCRDHGRTLDLEVLVANSAPYTEEQIKDGVRVIRVARWFTIAGAPICPGFRREIQRRPADIVHLHVPNPSATIAYLLSGHKGKLVITYHSDVVRQKILGRLFEPIMQMALRRAEAIIVTSPTYLDSSTSLRAHRDRCRIIPHGIDPREFFSDVPDRGADEVRRRFPGHIVLAVGRLTSYKGFEYLIEAAEDLQAHVLIVGEGGERRNLAREISDHGVADRVHLLGEVPNITSYYRAADVFVLPSVERSEAFGIVQLEAMACGIPVVNTNLASGVPYVSLHDETGLTVEPRNAKELGTAINWLLRHPRERKRLGDAAKRRVYELFHVDIMAEETLAVYESLLGFEPPTESSLPASSIA